MFQQQAHKRHGKFTMSFESNTTLEKEYEENRVTRRSDWRATLD